MKIHKRNEECKPSLLPLFQWAAERHHHRPCVTRWTINRWLGVERIEVLNG